MLDPDRIRSQLDRHQPKRLPIGGLRPSAVLLPIFTHGEEDMVLFTRRTETLSHHSGEISFPGGSRHESDADLVATALRETEEEMGIAAEDVQLLGRLDDCISVHGYHVAPFVGVFPYPYSFQVNEAEIAEVIKVPLHRLRDPAVYHEEDWRHRGRIFPVGFYTIDRHQIWGLTAEILRQFLFRVFAD